MRGRQTGEERERAARIFDAAGRAELWAAGAGAAEEGRGRTAGAARAHEERQMERELERELGSDAKAPAEGGGELGRAFDRWGREGGK
jgi:hypothetical protein